MENLYRKYCECLYRVTTDSRALKGGEMFFALKGENFDGNDYALSALQKGAAWAVVSRAELAGSDPRIIVVDDTFKALRDLAIYHRKQLRIPVLGLTGTNGKTTTKNLIEAVLASKFRVVATKGNLNNDLGVPLSVLSIDPQAEIAVIEMGASHPGDIDTLVEVSQPDYGLITNVGKAHLLGFGSFEGVKKTKGELYRYLGSKVGSTIFINEDDADLKEMSAGLPCHFYGYGVDYDGAKVLEISPEEPYLRLQFPSGETVQTQLVGSYNALNVLAALAVGEFFGVPREDAIGAVEIFCPSNKRSQMVHTEHNTLILDAYNANPSSMAAAIDNFALIHSPRKLALLGDMRELGADSVLEHAKIIDKLYQKGLQAVLVGEEFRKALGPGAEETGVWFPSSEVLRDFLSEMKLEGALILIKGSRGIEMEKVVGSL